MTIAQTNEPANQKPLRLWPGVVAAALLVLVRFCVTLVVPEAKAFAVLGGLVGGLAIVLWWVFFSRAPRLDRWGSLVLMAMALGTIPHILHKSVATGMMGLMFTIYAVPALGVALVAWAVTCGRLPSWPRRVSLIATILLACGVWALLRTNGITGDGASEFAWRWSETHEDRILATAGDEAATRPPTRVASQTGGDWPGFRGTYRDGISRSARISTNWSTSPPVALWRRPIGPGWSSFAVRGDLLYTQEQRGDEEVVACYNVTTGKPVWRHSDAARFWESNGGAGPRATPTVSEGRVYSFGATGILNALNADDGTLLWSRNVASDVGAKIPGWGLASSPLVVDDEVVVHARVLVAYDRVSGKQRWTGPARGGGYSSPQLMVFGGVAQILMMNGDGATSVAPADGKPL